MTNEVHAPPQRSQVDLFTPEEHRVLSYWFSPDPAPATAPCDLDEALRCLGITEKVHMPYEPAQAAVARILLEEVEEGLPNFGVLEGDELISARAQRPKELLPDRKVVMFPRHLFTVNWADSGPGFSWPGAYYATWVPVYDRYVVTYSCDGSELFGYCDFAIGHFGADEELIRGSRRVITADWEAQSAWIEQERWVYLFSEGLVDREEAAEWADTVWPEPEE